MTTGADLAIDLEATLQRTLVEIAERTRKAPFAGLKRDRTTASGMRGSGQTDRRHEGNGRSNQELTHQATPFAVARTGSEIDFGSGFVVSKMLSIGRNTRKCRKYQAVAIRDSRT